jgi:glycosyltransferase involved in cell wall biosynthesis
MPTMTPAPNPRVTVIMPSYNHERFVAAAIQSVLDQSFTDWELVITDDGSRDGTAEIARRFTDPRIRLFVFPQNRGACDAANHCIAKARGEFMAMLSSDDEFVPGRLQRQVAFLDEHPGIGAVFGCAQLIDEEGRDSNTNNEHYEGVFDQTNRSRHEWLNYFFLHRNCLCHPSVLIRKKCYDTVGLYDPRFVQLPDLDFWIRLCMAYEIHILPEVMVRFRILKNEANTSANTPAKVARGEFEFWQILRHYTGPYVREHAGDIFPELKTNDEDTNPDLFLRKVANRALKKKGVQPYWLFAMELMFNLQKGGTLHPGEFGRELCQNILQNASIMTGVSFHPEKYPFIRAAASVIKKTASSKLRLSLRKRLLTLEQSLWD